MPLARFIQDDINTYYFVNGVLQKTYAVEGDPASLNYTLAPRERGKSAAQLFSQSLWKVRCHEVAGGRGGGVFLYRPPSCAQVREDLAAMGCSAMLDKYDSYSVKVRLLDGDRATPRRSDG